MRIYWCQCQGVGPRVGRLRQERPVLRRPGREARPAEMSPGRPDVTQQSRRRDPRRPRRARVSDGRPRKMSERRPMRPVEARGLDCCGRAHEPCRKPPSGGARPIVRRFGRLMPILSKHARTTRSCWRRLVSAGGNVPCGTGTASGIRLRRFTALDRTSNQRMLMREGPTSRFRREGPGERGGCSGNSEG